MTKDSVSKNKTKKQISVFLSKPQIKPGDKSALKRKKKIDNLFLIFLHFYFLCFQPCSSQSVQNVHFQVKSRFNDTLRRLDFVSFHSARCRHYIFIFYCTFLSNLWSPKRRQEFRKGRVSKRNTYLHRILSTALR